MIWFIYILCGAGVMLALDGDRKEPLGFLGTLAALVCVVAWPLFFMFALTMTLRSLADHSPRDITVSVNPRPTKREM